jgi:hypothetical protein
MTDPDGGGNSGFDTFTVSGTKITSAINTAGACYSLSNSFSVTDTSTYKVILFFILNSGEAPEVYLEAGSGVISNAVTLVAGVNIVTLIATSTESGFLTIKNTGATNYSTSNIYVFKA